MKTPHFIQENKSIAPFTTIFMGGMARYFCEIQKKEHLIQAINFSKQKNIPVFMCGGGSNIIVSDKGFEGLMIRYLNKDFSIEEKNEGVLIRAGAGLSWDVLVERCVNRNLSGIECLSGIPGHAGATPIQNIGAYGQEISDTLLNVTVLDKDKNIFKKLCTNQCGFSYRFSYFKGKWIDRYIIISIELLLHKNKIPLLKHHELKKYLDASVINIQNIRKSVLAIRHKKGMLYDPQNTQNRNVGSFFLNPIISKKKLDIISQSIQKNIYDIPFFKISNDKIKISAAFLIERAGFSAGYDDGYVGISKKHALCIVNKGDAKSSDIISLASRIYHKVKKKFNILLRPEPIFIGFNKPIDILLEEYNEK